MKIGDIVVSKATGYSYKVIGQKKNRDGYICESVESGERFYFFDEEVDSVTNITECNGLKSVVSRANTHIVIKREDVEKHLNEEMKTALGLILSTISAGRLSEGKKGTNKYYICNTDEPYAEVVHGIILGGEAVKNKQLN